MAYLFNWKTTRKPMESLRSLGAKPIERLAELYRLDKDPHEMKNLIHSPEAAAQLTKMQQLLENAKEQYGYTPPPYQYEPPVTE